MTCHLAALESIQAVKDPDQVRKNSKFQGKVTQFPDIRNDYCIAGQMGNLRQFQCGEGRRFRCPDGILAHC
jgi:hypothetical protein